MSHTGVSIIVPKVIHAKHFGYILKNGVKCIIVQDPEAKIPAAAMSIKTGQLRDPPEFPGLAHFCEHMLFMGTSKFPKEDEFDSYISKNSGMNNAWTADGATTYYFKVADEAFEGALERFVEFFVDPSFNAGSVEREVKAVHSEDEKNHTVDYWRVDEIYRSLFSPAHPRHRYGNGNLTTLWDEPKARGDDLREALKKFYGEYYVSQAACIAVYSSRDPSEVLKVIEGPLSGMKEGVPTPLHFTPPEAGGQPFDEKAQLAWINVKTVRKLRQIRLMWPVRSASSRWRSMPGAYISHVLGHECDTSVLGVLKKRDWATAMVVGPSKIDDDFEQFVVEVSLTLSGITHVEEVVGLVYQGIGHAISGGIDARVYAQLKAEEVLAFESSDIQNAEQHCTAISTSANETDLQHCWVGGEMILEDDLEAALAYALQLTPEAAVVFLKWSDLPVADECAASTGEGDAEEVDEEEDDEGDDGADAQVAPEVVFASLPAFAQRKADQATRFHKALHSVSKVSQECVARWRAALNGPFCEDLALPSSNPFLATDFTIFPPVGDAPVEEEARFAHGVAYVRKDAGHHKTFKTALRLNTLSPVAYASPVNRLYTRVMIAILGDALTETSYYGELASLTNRLLFNPGGVGIGVYGPFEKLFPFLFEVVNKYLDVSVLQGCAEKYSTYMEAAIRTIQSTAMDQPYTLAFGRFTKLNLCLNYTFEEILATVPSTSYEGYKQFASDYLSSGLLFECFAAGNVLSREAVEVGVLQPLETILAAKGIPVPEKVSIPRFRDCYAAQPLSEQRASASLLLTSLDVLSFPPFNASDSNVCVQLSVYAGEECARTRALCDCAMMLIQSKFFNALRTREALGYVVFSSSRCVAQAAHVTFSVQSALDGVDGVYLLSRIIAFLEAVQGQLDAICRDDEVRKVAAGLILRREKKPDSVDADVSLLENAYAHPGGFGHYAAEIECLRTVSAQDVKQFFERVVLNTRCSARALAIVINSQKSLEGQSLMAHGGHTVVLPAQRPAENAEAPGEDDLQLPTFADGSSAVGIKVWESVEAYQAGLPVLRSTTF